MTNRVTLPAFLYQTESSLPAWHGTEHLFPGVGVRLGIGYRCGLWLIGTADGTCVAGITLHDRSRIPVLPFLYTRLVYPAQKPLGFPAKTCIRAVLACYHVISWRKTDGRIEDVADKAVKLFHEGFRYSVNVVHGLTTQTERGVVFLATGMLDE